MKLQSKKVAIVTGSNQGIGLETVKQLAQKGYRTLLCARTPAKAQEQSLKLQALGLDVIPMELDLSKDLSIENFVSDVSSAYEKVDLLINNAGVLLDLGVNPSDLDSKTHQESFRVNYFGPFALTQGLTPLLKNAKAARVINLSTQVASLAQLSDPDSPLKEDICPAYQASKVSVNVMTTVFAKELASFNVKVNSICPGWVDSGMNDENLPDYGEGVRPLSVEEAVKGFIWLTEDDPDLPTGKFYTGIEPVLW